MHTKSYNGFEIHFSGPDLHQDEIDSLMSILQNQLEEIDKYPDKSLFFQNPQIIEEWLALVRAIEKIETWEAAEDKTKWEDRTETYVAYLLTLRELFFKYQYLYKEYYDQLKGFLDGYGDWLVGECISTDGIDALLTDQYEQDIEDVENLNLFLTELNGKSLKSRGAVFSTISDVFTILLAVMNRGGQRVIDMNPSEADFAKAIDDDLREWTYSFGKNLFEDMKEDLNRHFKPYRTAPYTPQLWGELLSADEDALKKAMRQQLTTCEDAKQEHWGEDMKKQMDENNELMRFIYSSCRTEKLFNLNTVDSSLQLIGLLTPDNLSMFYDIIVRRSLIQCEMYPELKIQHEEWLNPIEEQQTEESSETGMSAVRQSKLDEIIGIFQKGDWKQPATAENIELLLNVVFGKDTSLLNEGDESQCEKMWGLVEGGRGNRMEVFPANLAGFFSEENLLVGSPKQISDDLFGNGNQVNNINKGKSNNRSQGLEDVIEYIKKYINKIIRQV